MVNDDLRIQKGLFALGDALAVAAAFAAALALHDPADAIIGQLLGLPLPTQGVIAAMTIGLWLVVFRSAGLYRMRAGGRSEFIAIVKGCSLAVALMLLGCFAVHVRISRLAFALAYVLSIPLVVTVRAAVRGAIRHLYANPKIAIPLAIVGFNSVAHYVCDQILDDITPFEPVGFIDPAGAGRQYRGLPVLGDRGRLPNLARYYPGLEVAIALPEVSGAELEQLVELCDRYHLGWWIVPSMAGSLAGGLHVELIGAVPLIGRRGSNIEGLNYVIKRGFDLAVGTLMLILAAPLIGLAALAIMLDDGGPIFFRQTRVGARGQLFEIFKLRTMRSGASSSSHQEYVQAWIRGAAAVETPVGDKCYKLAADNRITRAGRWLRRFSIDELPQLLNVVLGQMSLIGPRPALPYELKLYEEWHRGRLEGPPGLTGLWQVSGRNRLSFDEMVRLDLQYLEGWSLGRDLKILVRTLPVLLRGSGV